jgi:hypothetical protein
VRLTVAEFARGLVSWKAIPGVEIQVGTAIDKETPKQWSPNLTDPNGSLLPLELQAVFAFKIWLKSHESAIPLPEFWIRIERVVKGVVITRIFHGAANVQVMLRHLPDYGTYHRLVVDAGSFTWQEDVVFRQLGILVRFVTGEIEGERASDLKATIDEHGKPTLEGTATTVKETGRFVEVVTPGKSAQQAEQHAFATLGLLAVALGQNLLGRIVFSEPWQATPKEQTGVAIATGAAFARHAAATEVDLVDPLLFRMTVDEPIARARVISLRWYERGLRASAPLDKLLSFFIGVETLVAAFAKNNAPLPVEQARKPEDDKILQLIKKLGGNVVSRVAQRIRGASLREQFAYYAQAHGLGADATSRFDKSKKVRDSAVHGDAVEVTFDVAGEAEKLLHVMLKAAFGVQGKFAWEDHPVIQEVRMHFALVAADAPPGPQPAAP